MKQNAVILVKVVVVDPYTFILRWENRPVNRAASRETGLEMPCFPAFDLLWVQITQSYANRLRFYPPRWGMEEGSANLVQTFPDL